MYLYEMHLHTAPVSACAGATPEESVRFYHRIGYDGLFITNHFIDGNIAINSDTPYEDKIRFYFADYYAALETGKELGCKVYSGLEMCHQGTEFLIYGLEEDWFLAHPEIQDMPISQKLTFMRQCGALVIQAHPYREASYIDHIRLFPRQVDGVEVFNAGNAELANSMAKAYAEGYGLRPSAGSDNHIAARQRMLGGLKSDAPITDMQDFITRFKAGDFVPFAMKNPLF
ncbi:MAG: histidinol-phosphatase [Clostridiales bacterium]|nr:histidinol-phosphatase [Clostridiales bacterium]